MKKIINQIPGSLSPVEKRTFALHFSFSIIEGAIAGLLIMNEFIFLKSLEGSNTLLAVLFQLSVVLFVFAAAFNEFSRRVANKKKLIFYTAVITRFPLLLFIFFPTDIAGVNKEILHLLFLFTFLIYFLAHPVIFPAINLLLKSNYSKKAFGKLFSYATTAKQIAALVATFVFGLVLDADNFAFRYVYPFMGLSAMFSVYLLSKIDVDESQFEVPTGRKGIFTMLKDSTRNLFRIVSENKPYRDFEAGFMLYGFAFMATAAVVTIFLAKQLELSFTGIAFYKNFYNTLGIIMMPFFGRLIGKTDPRKFGAITFSALLLHFFFLIVTQWFPYHFMFFGLKLYPVLIVSYIFHGIFAATMGLLWAIGSAYFCPKNEAADYQSVHLTLVGFRAIFSPLIGVGILSLFSYSGVFWSAIIALFVGIIILLKSMKKHAIDHDTT